MDTRRAMIVHEKDNVATALSDLIVGDQVTLMGPGKPGNIVASQPIPFGHKIAIIAIEKGEAIVKYGEVIGRATQQIILGKHVHIHNVESLRGRGDVPG
ncbi:MAG: UxaA family hydrolase [Candidatus Bathyarchaeota archaeon]|nr:UxaA family hydrolase [Candidatus Bathyarchaeota archaeon]